ncbi:MAG: branched-chain amino acid ABC transporter permease [Verrucomicrobia bacterium]|nr:MAG: branched-chain amino acid ABC transporter permease [Verrucomicrobiota bacterium]
MAEFLQQLVNGLSLGSIYALIALGYTMVYGVLRFINFAHSDVFMVGAFAGYYFSRLFQAQSLATGLAVLAAAMAVCAALGILIERLAYRPLRGRSTLTVLITAIGMSLFLQNSGQLIFGANPKSFPQLFPEATFKWELGGAGKSAGASASVEPSTAPSGPRAGKSVTLSSYQLVVFAVTVVLLFALRHIVMRTRIGTAMRALSFNPTAAALVGINIDRVISFTFGLGSALAAAGGILYALNYRSIDPLMGTLPGLKAFVAAVLGGIGNIPGAALGGLVLGVVEAFVGGTGWSTYRDAIAFAVLILILLFKPAGMLGRLQVEKV